MKLLMISGDRSVLQEKRGAFFYTLEAFSKQWDRIDIICPNPGAEFLKKNRKRFGNVYFHPCEHSLIWQISWIVRKGEELISKHHHDVITAHDFPPFYNGFGALLLRRKTGKPIVSEIHHVVGWPKTASLSEKIGRVLSHLYFKFIINRFDAIRVVNQSVWDAMASWGVKTSKMHLVPSIYLDTEFFEMRREWPDVDKKYDVSFCGRLVPNKGLLNIIQAVSELPEVSLLVMVDGPMRATAIKKVLALNIQHRVRFVGWQPSRRSVALHLLASKIFVMNSTSEGGPRVAIEAMALGLPIITTRVGVMPDFIRHNENGLITDGSVRDLKRKIAMLLSDNKFRQSLGLAASRFDFDRFERSVLIRKYAYFLHMVVPSKLSIAMQKMSQQFNNINLDFHGSNFVNVNQPLRRKKRSM